MQSKSIKKQEPLGSLYMLPIPRESFEKINKAAINRGMTFPEFLARAVEEYMKEEEK